MRPPSTTPRRTSRRASECRGPSEPVGGGPEYLDPEEEPRGWNVERVVADANALLDVTGDTDTVLAAASHVEEHGPTPFDALHLVNSTVAPIVSSDSSYDDFSERIPLEPPENE